MEQRGARLAILDMYESTVNLGMKNISEIVARFGSGLLPEVFDVRSRIQVPDLSYDIYIFSGGPGNPLVGDESWLKPFHGLIDDLWQHNKTSVNKKYVFFICHSFQMACHHFGIGEITRRRKKSFGTFPVQKTEAGKEEHIFEDLKNQFWIADFREYQVIRPNLEKMSEIGAQLLCIEKEREHVNLERAMMAIRFSDEMIGTQFHPEADPEGMRSYFQEDERRTAVIEEYGAEKLDRMIEVLNDESKIHLTYSVMLPSFLKRSISQVREAALQPV